MTYKEESFVLAALRKIVNKTHENNVLLKENNRMLKELIKVTNHELANARKENEDDFGRNVLANILSDGLRFNRRKR